MQHPDSRQLLDYIDGLLSPKQSEEFLAHADSCPACRALIEQESAISDAMRSQPLVQPSSVFDRSVLDAVLPRTAAAGRHAVSLRKYAGIFALCTFTLILFLFSSDGSSHESATWMQPVNDFVSRMTGSMTERFTLGIQRLFAPLTSATAHSSILEIFGMATAALLLLGGIDHIISPLLKKGR